MKMSKRIIRIALVLSMLLVFSFVFTVYAEDEMPSGKYMTLIDEKNNVILQTATVVSVGDEYISADNSRYMVKEVITNTARCVYKGKEVMPTVNYDSDKKAWIFDNSSVPVVSSKNPTIALYHTHSDESYVPSDGKESINGNGGIYDVGQALNEKLKSLGFNVVYNQNNHNPHDINAYNRSRRTATSLLKKQPDAIIDVHRDAVPASQYQTEVKGKKVTKVKLVVGRQNPNMKTNLEFAKRLKAVMDRKAPGLSNGIYMGKGDYNQDLSPRAMLIEVGAHTNSKAEAEKGVMLFANSLPTVLGVSSDNAVNTGISSDKAGPAKKPLNGENKTAGTTIALVLTVVAAVIAGYYWLNRRTIDK
ncbi:MAG: stage II sporulation protein P [Syntrophomonadaceae bacterium]|nr:stage II sporulation protein P [Syntrophomonadaceae bacterium]